VNSIQGVTSCWKSVHRITGYEGYKSDIRGIINRYQEEIDEISIKYQTDFGKILRNISWIYLSISQTPVDSFAKSKNLEKLLKTAMFRPNLTAGYQGYQPDIKAFCTPDIMRCYPLRLSFI